jgi:hypothetical protein
MTTERTQHAATGRLIAALVLALALSVTVGVLPAASADYQSDAWIKLCGLSTGCTIDPLPHPWKGQDVYNTTGAKQSVVVRMEDGEGVRFWITVENDGDLADTLTVDGCRGTRRFKVNSVLIGKHKRPDWRATNVTKKYKDGTLEFTFPPASEGKTKVFTLNIIAPTTAEGVTYRCVTTIRSANRWAAHDTVVAKMTTY